MRYQKKRKNYLGKKKFRIVYVETRPCLVFTSACSETPGDMLYWISKKGEKHIKKRVLPTYENPRQ